MIECHQVARRVAQDSLGMKDRKAAAAVVAL